MPPLRALAAPVVALALAGCAGPAQCKPGPPAVYVTLGSTDLPPGAVVTVCAGRAGCVTQSSLDGTFSMISGFPRRLPSRDLDGTVATARSGTRTARATMRFHDGGRGECAYSWTSADLELGPGEAEVLAPGATLTAAVLPMEN